jgi:signal transduction histidine kinase/ligand-binding sensor domain-containing protein/ActR/RegA family two-component response regulator
MAVSDGRPSWGRAPAMPTCGGRVSPLAPRLARARRGPPDRVRVRPRVARTALALALALVSVAAPTHALEPDRHVSQYLLRTWAEGDGLPQLAVTAVTQSRSGALWVGTQEGLARFDGAAFVVVDRRRQPTLGQNFVHAVAPRSGGGVWVGTHGGVVAVDELGQVSAAPDGRAGGAPVTVVHEDRRGRLWVASQGGALERLDAGGWTRLDRGGRGAWRAVFEDADGALWLGGDDGLVVARGDRLVDVEAARGARVGAVARGGDGALWVGTERGLARLVVDGDVAAARLVDVSGVAASVVALATDAQQNVWIAATGAGLGRLRAGVVEWLGHDLRFATDDLRALFLDADGALWLASAGGGLGRLTDPPIIPLGAREGLPRDVVFAVLERAPGELVVGTQGGLAFVGPRGIEAWTTREGLASNFITALHAARDGGLWVGTIDDGLDHVAGARVTHFGAAQGLPAGRVFAVIETRAGEVVVGAESGLFVRAPGAARFAASSAVGEVLVTALGEDPRGRLWVGTQTSGLVRLGAPGADGARAVDRRFDAEAGLGDAFVTTLAIDAAGDAWVGTASGLARVEGDHARALGGEGALALGMVLSIVEDLRGHLWVGTNRGLVRFGLEALEGALGGAAEPSDVVRLDRSDGLRSAEFNGGFQPAGIRAADGRLWFSTMGGLVALDPLRLQQGPGPPPPQVDELQGDGRLADVGPDGAWTFGAGTQTIELRYGVVAPSRADTLTFRYRLEGFDPRWVEAGARRSVIYTNLAAGTYRFHVEVCVTDGRCRATSSPRVFTIEPHALERPSVLAAIVASLLSLAWTLHRLRLRGVRRRAAELEALVAGRTAELADEVRVRERAEREAHQAREHAERALVEAVEARARAELSARAKTEFLANISHEIRTPMNAVLGMIDLTLGTPLDANQREMLGVARGGADGLLHVLNDVLDLSKIESGTIVLAPVRFALRERLEAAIAALRYQAKAKGLTLTATVSPDVDAVFVGDPDRLRQVLLNLVSNAVKFTAFGGVEVEVTRASPRRADGSCLVGFAIRDTGIGIPATRLAAIFEPFEQADGSATRLFGGTGLGLTIARKLVERMGGTIEVESEPGLGSTFRFSVAFGCVEVETRPPPGVAAAPAAASARPSASAPTSLEAPPRALDVLLAEDNLVNQRVAKRMLESLGHRVVVASNGAEAVEAVGRQAFDVILMDVHMPELDGIEATRRIRAAEAGLARRIPIVAVTAGALDEDRTACFEAGMDAFVPKPVRAATLAEVLAGLAPAPREGLVVRTAISLVDLEAPPPGPS